MMVLTQLVRVLLVAALLSSDARNGSLKVGSRNQFNN
jgi:hypothetical protein